MTNECLIVGSGVAAGLASRVLRRTRRTLVSTLPCAAFSPMPECAPRRAFFDALEMTAAEESDAVDACAPRFTRALLTEEDACRVIELHSDAATFVFDKGRLATWLLAGVESAPRSLRDKSDIAAIAATRGACDILDCRGGEAIRRDPNYRHAGFGAARTACAYAFVRRPAWLQLNEMRFWGLDGGADRGADRIVAFCAPLGEARASFGCSHSPQRRMRTSDLIHVARRLGLAIELEADVACCEVAPCPTTHTTDLAQVTPLGEARVETCPLTEYGALAALSQALAFVGDEPLTPECLHRTRHDCIDPHLPTELER